MLLNEAYFCHYPGTSISLYRIVKLRYAHACEDALKIVQSVLKMGKISLVMNAPAKGKWQFSTFPNFEISETKSHLFMLFSKIGHQIKKMVK